MKMEKHKKTTDEIAINLGKHTPRGEEIQTESFLFGGKSNLMSTTGGAFPPIYCNFVSGFLVLFHLHNVFS